MHRYHLVKILILLIVLLFVSNLMADAAKQQLLETSFRTATDFEGTIIWWDDDTMKSLDGHFPDMEVFYDDDPDYQDMTMADIFTALVPYTGLSESDFFDAEVNDDSYTYMEKLNGMYIESIGYIDIYMNENDELTIGVYTLPKVSAPTTPNISEDQAYALLKTMADETEIIPQVDAKLHLMYVTPVSDTDIMAKKPTNLPLAWVGQGKTNYFCIDALTGKLIKKKAIN